MRICRGSLKGKVLKPPKLEGLRVTQEKVREALWSILYPFPKGSFLDLFSGSGIISFEAYSMGFSPVCAVEIERKLCNFIREKSEEMEIFIRVHNEDVLKFLKNKKGKEKYMYIYMDPPYDYKEISPCLTLSLEILEKEGFLILEYPPNLRYFKEPYKIYKYGKTWLYFFNLNS